MGNLSKALFTVAAITTVSVGTVISASLAKADTFMLTQNTPSPQPQSGKNDGSVTTVIADTKVYSDPGTNYKVVGSLLRGAKVVILDSVSRGDTTWYRVVGKNQKDNYRSEGWIQSNYLSPQSSSSDQNASNIVTVTADTRVFAGPGTDYIVRAFLARGTKVVILDSVSKGDATWYKIGGKQGDSSYRPEAWIQGNYLSLGSQPPSSDQSAGDTATDLAFQTSNYAVRVYRQGEQTLMNVFDKQDKITFLRGTPVSVEPNPEGYNYANTSGEVKVKVFHSRNSNTHSIQVGNNSPELSL